jgi:hypothetical protein
VKVKKKAARKITVKARRRPPVAKPAKARPTAIGERRSFDGGCHCGAIEYIYTTTLSPARWPVRLCQCGFCRGHGVRATSDPAGELRFRFERPEFLRRYRFALRTADFLVCKECGIFVGAVLLSVAARRRSSTSTPCVMSKVCAPARPSHDGESGDVRRGAACRPTPVAGPV